MNKVKNAHPKGVVKAPLEQVMKKEDIERARKDVSNVVAKARETNIELRVKEMRALYKLQDLRAEKKINRKAYADTHRQLIDIRLQRHENRVDALLKQQAIINKYNPGRVIIRDAGVEPHFEPTPGQNWTDAPTNSYSTSDDAPSTTPTYNASNAPVYEDVSDESSQMQYVYSSQTHPTNWGIVWKDGSSTFYTDDDFLVVIDPNTGQPKPPYGGKSSS